MVLLFCVTPRKLYCTNIGIFQWNVDTTTKNKQRYVVVVVVYMTKEESADSLKTTYTQRNLLYMERDAGVLLWSRFGRGPD